MLKDRVRNDWDFPVLPQYRTHTLPPVREEEVVDADTVARLAGVGDVEERVAGFRFHSQSTTTPQPGHGELDFDAVEWRERECSSEDDVEDVVGRNATMQREKDKDKVKNSMVEYQFDTPDSVGLQVSSQREARKRRQGHVLHEEMVWNEGLRHWVERRDLWCSARTKAQVRLLERSARADPEASSSASAGTSPRTSTSTASIATSSMTADSPAVYASASTTPDLHPLSQTLPATSSTQLQHFDLLIPVAPQLLPNHPVRRRVSPAMYAEIYTKIIVQSRTPSVPINLGTLISALVKGWKENGEWPPKLGAPEPGIARKKGSGGGKGEGGSGFRNGVKAVGRVLRLTSTGS